ncbi:DUF6371 domain-containing protein [Niabella sp. 22666]|uniref:DUF6371 domain-containing protein n=1 Tax=Niabella sp. 22666 TaxID=3453954 RepID=UPI003F834E39
MRNFRYHLDNGKGRKYKCPSCGHDKRFTRYVDLEGASPGDEYGRCDRENNCGYIKYPPSEKKEADIELVIFDEINDHNHKCYKATIGESRFYIPKSIAKDVVGNTAMLPSWFINNNPGLTTHKMSKAQFTQPAFPDPYYIPYDDVTKSLTLKDNFSKYIIKEYGENGRNVLLRYFVGISNSWMPGATIFFTIDNRNIVRRGSIIHYDIETLKRGKANSVHSIRGKSDQKPDECLFGLHLLNEDPSKPIAIVEAPKTAIIGSIYLPSFTWMACEGLRRLSINKMQPLRGRKIVLFPDRKGYDLWTIKATEFEGFNIKVSRILEDNISGPNNDCDIADYLMLLNPKDLQKYPIEWDQPIDWNNYDLHWRWVNWLQNLESFIIDRDLKAAKIITDEMVTAGMNDLPDELTKVHAPTTYKLSI